jgi:hypothetical protein
MGCVVVVRVLVELCWGFFFAMFWGDGMGVDENKVL